MFCSILTISCDTISLMERIKVPHLRSTRYPIIGIIEASTIPANESFIIEKVLLWESHYHREDKTSTLITTQLLNLHKNLKIHFLMKTPFLPPPGLKLHCNSEMYHCCCIVLPCFSDLPAEINGFFLF